MDRVRWLVALDGSPRAPDVLAQAASMAGGAGAELLLLRVAHLPPEFPATLFTIATDSLRALYEDECRRGLEDLAKAAPPGRVGELRVRLGTPWRVICDEARAADVGLIVIGAHGYGPLERAAGTTAARVAEHADRAVLVVRPGAHAAWGPVRG